MECVIYTVNALIHLLSYSTDEGHSWSEARLFDHPIFVYGLLNEPGEKNTVFFVFGSETGSHNWLLVTIDLRNVFGRLPSPWSSLGRSISLIKFGLF